VSFPWLSVLWLLPVAGAALVLMTPRRKGQLARVVALGFSLLTLAVSIVVGVRFAPNGAAFQFTESHAWIKAFGVSYSLGLDGIALALTLMTTVLMPLVLLASWHDVSARPAAGATEASAAGERPPHVFFALMLLVEGMVLVSFLATDVFLFYVFFEAMLVPMYFLIGSYGGAQRSYAAVKFLLYNLLGGLVMLAAVIGLYVVTADHGAGTFDFATISHAVNSGALGMSPAVEKALFLGFMFAFAVKAPLWPFHTWLPDALTESTAGSAVLITCLVDKVGTFAMLRYCLQLFPHASRYFTPVIIVLAVVGILYGALVAVGQKDIKRLLAYTSVSHFGFIVLGIFVFTSQGQAGSTLYMVNHGFSTAAMFLIAGFMISRRGSRLIADFGGVHKVAPLMAGTFLVAGLSMLSLPGLSPFVSEFLVLVGSFSRYQVAAVFATAGIVLAALYVLVLYQRTMTGPLGPGTERMKDLRPREVWAVGPLLLVLVFLGVYPKPALDVINPAVNRTLTVIHTQDPAPTVGTVSAGTTTGGNK
jgi:NADH-quinone oxidoreductase subunit M